MLIDDRGFIPNRDKIGYSGVETSLDEILLGKNGQRVVQIDVAGQVLRNLEPPVAPVPGNNVVLTIDTRLQKAAEAALIDEINYPGYFLWNSSHLKRRGDRHEPQDRRDPCDGLLSDI